MMILLPYCVRFNLERGHHAGLYGELLRALRPDLDKSSLTAEERDILFSAALFELNQYLHDHYDVPITLSQLGVERDILPKVARQARYDVPLFTQARSDRRDRTSCPGGGILMATAPKQTAKKAGFSA